MREDDMDARVYAAEQRLIEQQKEARTASLSVDESVDSIGALRSQLLVAVANEASARGAAQEMAELLKEQQSKLTSLAEARRELQDELACVRCQAAEELHEANEVARQASVAQRSSSAAAAAKLTREQLAHAQTNEESSARERHFTESSAKLVKEHADALRIKQVMLDDMSSQVAQAREAAQSAQGTAAQAGAARDAALRVAETWRGTHDALRASEETVVRLEAVLQELERTRMEALAEAEAARQDANHRGEMLDFVESEVRATATAAAAGSILELPPAPPPNATVLPTSPSPPSPGAFSEGHVCREGAGHASRGLAVRGREGCGDPSRPTGPGAGGGCSGARGKPN